MISNYLDLDLTSDGTTGLGQELNWPFYPFRGSCDDNHCDDNDDDHYDDNDDDNVIEVHRV